jgi:hypothetical protein
MKVQRKASPPLDAMHTTTTSELMSWVTDHGGSISWFYHPSFNQTSGDRWYALVEFDGTIFGPVRTGEVVVVETVGGVPQLHHMEPLLFEELYSVVPE